MRIIFMGTPEMGAMILKGISKTDYRPFLAITAPDKPQGRGAIDSESAVAELARLEGIEIFKSGNIKNLEEKLSEESPDLIISAAFGKILTKKIIDIPRFGALNIHPSLLPAYRGASPIQNAILNGDKETGVTIMVMNEKIDQGKIIAQVNVPIEDHDNYKTLSLKLSQKSIELLVEVLPRWIEGKITPVSQKGKTTYTKPIKKEDGKINWKKPAEYIERQVRAFDPWPGTYCFFEKSAKGEKKKVMMKVLESEIQEQTEVGPFGKPGKVFLASNGNIAIQTGKHFLIIKKLQLEGKAPVKTEDFLNGNIDFIGTILK